MRSAGDVSTRSVGNIAGCRFREKAPHLRICRERRSALTSFAMKDQFSAEIRELHGTGRT
jgi:hypothetical protein